MIEFLTDLSRKIPAITLVQFEQAYSSRRNSARELSHMTKDGLLFTAEHVAESMIPVCGAQWEWPAQPRPNCTSLSNKLQTRFDQHPVNVQIWWASPTTTRWLGGAYLEPSWSALTHELLATEVFLHVRRTEPHFAANWLREDLLRLPRKRKKPDAACVDADGEIELAIEVGGTGYTPEQLKSKFREVESGRWPKYRLY